MKNRFLIFIISAICLQTATAQSIAGKWYGIGRVKKAGVYNNYLSELIISVKGTKVTGEYNYYFGNDEIKTKITGTYNSKYRLLELDANPILNFQAKDANGADCPMEGSFTLRVSRVETSLTGQFNPIYDYRYTCPAINIKFVKQLSPPPVVDITDTVEDELAAPIELPKAAEPKEDPIVRALIERSFDVPDVIEVDADSLRVTLYDNGEVDNDTISLFYNRKLVAHKQMLSDKPMNFTFALDTSINEISMFAENLGTISPNTALAIIYAGDKRYELGMTSTFIKNAAIRFRRKIKDVKNIN